MRIALASLVVFAGACGDDGGVRHLDGGPTVDSPPVAIDAPNTPQPVTLTVTGLTGLPQQNVKVYFLANDSTVISNTVTDATGVASAVMPSGGTVTAIDPFAAPAGSPITTYDVYTFEGVKAADHLKLAPPQLVDNGVTVDIPLDPTQGVTDYYIGTPCGFTRVPASQGSGSTLVAQVPWSTHSCDTTSDFLVMSLDGSGQGVNYFFVPNQSIAAPTDLSAKTYVTTTAKTYTFTNLSTTFPSSQVQQLYASAHGLALQTAQRFEQNLLSTQTPDSYTFEAPNFAGALDIVVISGSNGGYGTQHLVQWGPFSTTYTTDVAARALVDVTGLPTIDATTHQVTWTEGATGVAPDATALTASFSRNGNVISYQWNWHIAAPHTANSLTFPTLPTDVFDFNFTTSDGLDLTNANDMKFYRVPGGYDTLRANVFALQESPNPIASVAATATGQVAIEEVQTARVTLRQILSPKLLHIALPSNHSTKHH